MAGAYRTARGISITPDTESPNAAEGYGVLWVNSVDGRLRYVNPDGDDVDASGPPEDWIEVQGGVGFQNSWINYNDDVLWNTAAYYRDNSRVYLKGLIEGGIADTVVFTLPAGYRPVKECVFAVAASSLFGEVRVQPDGDVIFKAGTATYVSLDGISFRIA